MHIWVANLEVPLRVFTRDSALDGVPPGRGDVLLLADAQALQGGPPRNLDLGLHQVNLGYLLRHRVLHLPHTASHSPPLSHWLQNQGASYYIDVQQSLLPGCLNLL